MEVKLSARGLRVIGRATDIRVVLAKYGEE
jgi:ribosomal protein L28